MVWDCEGHCGGHGDCIDERCSCDFGWFGTDCSEAGKELWAEFWPVYRGVFITAYALVSLWTGYRLRNSVRKQTSFCTLQRLYSSPKYVSLSCLIAAGVLRTFWLSIDPFSFHGVSTRISDRLLYELPFPLLYIPYTTVLLVW
jgi:hypothetical protein